MSAALAMLEAAGTDIVPIDVPEAPEREKYFPVALPADLISVLGRDRFLAGRERMDPVVAARGGNGLEVKAAEVLQLKWGRQQLCAAAEARFEAQVAGMVAALPQPLAPDYCSELNPQLGPWVQALAEALANLERYEPALQHVEKAIELAPEKAQGDLGVARQLSSLAALEVGVEDESMLVEGLQQNDARRRLAIGVDGR